MTVSNVNPTPKEAFMRALRLDHSRLSRVFREIDLQQAALQSNAQEARAVLKEAMDYLLQYQDGFHHAREDRLFERIAQRLPHLRKDMRALMRDHAQGHLHDAQIAAELASASVRALEGLKGERLAKRIGDHVAYARAHIRSEEEVFYRRAEDELTPADWAELMRQADMDDPLVSPDLMHRQYPHLASRLQASVNEVTGAGSKPARPRSAAARRLEAAARAAFEQAVEASGKFVMDALELARENAAALRQAHTPLDLLLAGHRINVRNGRFALRCLVGPHRWMWDTVAGAWRASTPDGQVFEPQAPYRGGVVHVAAIKNDR